MFHSGATDWAALAHAIGFTPHEPVANFGSAASFRQLKRSLGPVAPPAPHLRHWLRGTRSGHRVIATTYTVSSGSSHDTWTSLAVEIDPPLLLGVSIGSDSRIQTFFSGKDLQLGIPGLDDALRLGAVDAERLRALLFCQAGEPYFLMKLASLVKTGFSVTDSTVVWSRQDFVTNPYEIIRAIDTAAWIADQLVTRRAAMPAYPPEQQIQSRWQAFADERGLTFDASRMHMYGTIADAGVEIALETNGGLIKTGIGVRFPQPIAFRLHLERTHTLSFLRKMFSTTIATGDPAFDSAFVIRGAPPELIRQVFSIPDLRATLLEIAYATREVTMTESQVFWLWPAPTLDAATLDQHLGAAINATTALFRAAKSQGPYR